MGWLTWTPKLATFRIQLTLRYQSCVQKYRQRERQRYKCRVTQKLVAQQTKWVLLDCVLLAIGTNVVGKFDITLDLMLWDWKRIYILSAYIPNLINLTRCIIEFLYFCITDFHISDQEDTGALMQMVQLVPATDSICQLR